MFEQSIPEELRMKAFIQWLTGYFEHGNLSDRDLNTLSYVLPSTIRAPSIFNMSKAELTAMLVDGEEAAPDYPLAFLFGSQIKAAYRKTFYEPKTADVLPHLRVTFFTGEYAPAWGPAALWAVQDEEKQSGCGRV